ncbi:MAG: glutamate synthase-related protein [Desulfobacterales bacterium]
MTWDQVSSDWACQVCESGKPLFRPVDDGPSGSDSPAAVTGSAAGQPEAFEKTFDDFETYMADIHAMAETGESIIEPMRTCKPTFSWDDILIKGAQLAKIPLNCDHPVNTRTNIGPGAGQPLVVETPIYITHMSFGALSKDAKLALARGSAAVKTAMCSGEGGILPESRQSAYNHFLRLNQRSIQPKIATNSTHNNG